MFIIIIKFTPLIVYIDGVAAECFMPFLVKKRYPKLQDGCEPGCPLPF